MPYINKKYRQDYFPIIENVLNLVRVNDPINSAEYVGYFLGGVIGGFIDPDMYMPCKPLRKKPKIDQWNNPFVVFCEDEEKKIALDKEIYATLDLLHAKNVLDRAGELNYVCSCVIWGFLGDSSLFESARYATRAYMRGVVNKILKQHYFVAAMPFEKIRARIMLEAVVGDILDELYRRRTSVYEDSKIKESGDIWPLRVEELNIKV